MTAEQVRGILAERFTDESDRKYWEEKLAELETKETAAKENSRYFRKMRVYDR